MSDTELIQQAQKDPGAFEAIYMMYADRIYNYFWYRTGHDRDIAEDLMQETFMKAFNALPRYTSKGYSYHTYLRAIAHNVLVSYYRSPKTNPLDTAKDMPDQLKKDMENILDARLVWDAVRDNLTRSERDIILMKYRKDLPVKEIAHIVGTSENAVKLTLSRARKKLRKDIRLSSLKQFKDVSRPYTSPRFLRNI